MILLKVEEEAFMRRKERKYAALICAFAMVFSSLPVYASDNVPADVTENKKMQGQKITGDQEVELEKQNEKKALNESEIQSEINEDNAEISDIPQISEIGIEGIEDKENIKIPANFNVKIKMENLWSQGVRYIKLTYKCDEEVKEFENKNIQCADDASERDELTVPINLEEAYKKGQYSLVGIKIVEANTDNNTFIEYKYDSDVNAFIDGNGNKYVYSGEADFNIIKSEITEQIYDGEQNQINSDPANKKQTATQEDVELEDAGNEPSVISLKFAEGEKDRELYGNPNESVKIDVKYKANFAGDVSVTIQWENEEYGNTFERGRSFGQDDSVERSGQIDVGTGFVVPGKYRIISVVIRGCGMRYYRPSDDSDILVDNFGNKLDISNVILNIRSISDNGLKLSNVKWNDEKQVKNLRIGDSVKGCMTIKNESQKDVVVNPKTCYIWWSAYGTGEDRYARGEGSTFVLKSRCEKEIPFTLSIGKGGTSEGQYTPTQIILNGQDSKVSTKYMFSYSGEHWPDREYKRIDKIAGNAVEGGIYKNTIDFVITEKTDNTDSASEVKELSNTKETGSLDENIKLKIKLMEEKNTPLIKTNIQLKNKITGEIKYIYAYIEDDLIYSEKDKCYIVNIRKNQLNEGEYYVEQLTIFNQSNCMSNYSIKEDGKLYSSSDNQYNFQTVSFTCIKDETTKPDYTAPILDSIELVSSNKVTSPGEVTYRIKASDTNKLSEVRLFYLYNKGVNAMTLKSSSIKEESEGTYLCTFKIEEYHETGDYQLYTIGLIDSSVYKNDRAYKYNEKTGEFESQDIASVKVSGNLVLTKEGNEVIASGEKNLEDEVKKASEGTTIVVVDLQKELIIPTETMKEIKDKKLTLVVSDDDRTSKLIINGNDLAKVPNKDLKVSVERGRMTEEEIQVGTEKDEIYYPVNVTTTDASVPVTLCVKLDSDFLKQIDKKNISLSRRNAEGSVEKIKEQVSVTKDGYVEYIFANGLVDLQETKQSLPTELDKLYSAVTQASDLNETVEEYEFIISASKKKKTDVVLGDINQDGSINIQDLMLCLNHVSQKTLLTEDALMAADVDESGNVNIQDLMLLLNYVSGKSNVKFGHNYELTKSEKATCVKEGYEEYTCTRCGDSYRTKIPVVDHDYDKTVEVNRVESTCATKGYVEYKCKNCDDILKEELALNPENHKYTLINSDLTYNYYSCSGCGASYQEYNDQEYAIDLGNGKTTTVVGHYDIAMAERIGELVNERRTKWGLKTLNVYTDTSATIGEAALIRGPELAVKYDHTRPNGERAIVSFVSFAGTMGENIAKGQKSAEQVFHDWCNSPGHDANQTSDRYYKMGVAVFVCKIDDEYYSYNFVQLFG